MTEHTPTPWSVPAIDRSGCVVCDEHGKIIFVLRHPFGSAPAITNDDMAANGTFIVKACNAHEALVNALGKIIELDTCVSDGGKRHDHGFWAGLAIGALESAGVTSPVSSADRAPPEGK